MNNGVLYLCATPIGNLNDVSKRLIDTLNGVDLIFAEDTRQSLKLLRHFGIKKPLVSYHEHNKLERGNLALQELRNSKSIAVVTDAGTPAISDPGGDLVRLCIENDIEVVAIPGACALICGLIVSGLRTERFCFEGFLPREKRHRTDALEELKDERRTMIFYEAPHRLKKTLKDMERVLGNRRISLSKELTKLYENTMRTDINTALSILGDTPVKGEYVIVVEGCQAPKEDVNPFSDMTVSEHYNSYVSQGMTDKEAIKQVALERDVPKKDIYRIIHFG